MFIKKKQLKKIFCLTLGLLLFLWGTDKAAAENNSLQQEVIRLANQERSNLGLNELKENSVLDQAAMMKAEDMLKENYFSHTSPQGVDPWFWFEKAGYNYKYAGENLAMDFSSAGSVHRAWMKSPTHRENIVSNKFSEIGVAVVEGKLDGRETYLAVELFGTASSEEAVAFHNFLEKENLTLSIKESSVFPWKNSAGKNEALIFAEVSGLADNVSAVINGQSYPLEKIKDNNYLSLVSLSDWTIGKDQVVIVAKSPFGWEISELILPTKYFGYFHEQSVGRKEIVNSEKDVLAAGVAEERALKDFFSSQRLRDGVLLFGVLVFCLTIANIWILEKEEERLLLKKCV